MPAASADTAADRRLTDDSLTADVLVVGAGPAGSAAAVHLRRRGRTVIVIDRAVFPRDKCCGDGLTTLALRDLRPAHMAGWQPVAAAWLRSPSGREVCLDMPPGGTFAATAPRRDLDAALLRLARGAGAEVFEGHALKGVRQLEDRVAADVEGLGTVHARYLLAADGMWSPTRKLLGASEPGYMGEWHAFRQYAHNVTGPAAQRLYVWFEPDLLPGYAWSFPLPDGRVNLGFGVPRGSRTGKEMSADWAGLAHRPHIREALGAHAELEDRPLAWPIPAGIDKATLSAGRVLFLGDAARASDVMTGEGIGQAVLTGRLAAEALSARGALDPAAVRAGYERAIRHHLIADHRASVLLNGWLRSPFVARGAVRIVGLNGWTRRYFVRWMFEDEPRAVAFTPRRWHRRFLRRPAPYD